MDGDGSTSAVAVISVIAVALCPSSVLAQLNAASGEGSELQRNSPPHEVGRRFRSIRRPAGAKATIMAHRSLIVPYREQTLQVPDGFVAAPYVTRLANARRVVVLSTGRIRIYPAIPVGMLVSVS